MQANTKFGIIGFNAPEKSTQKVENQKHMKEEAKKTVLRFPKTGKCDRSTAPASQTNNLSTDTHQGRKTPNRKKATDVATRGTAAKTEPAMMLMIRRLRRKLRPRATVETRLMQARVPKEGRRAHLGSTRENGGNKRQCLGSLVFRRLKKGPGYSREEADAGHGSEGRAEATSGQHPKEGRKQEAMLGEPKKKSDFRGTSIGERRAHLGETTGRKRREVATGNSWRVIFLNLRKIPLFEAPQLAGGGHVWAERMRREETTGPLQDHDRRVRR